MEARGRRGGGRKGGWPENRGAVAAATDGVGEHGGVGFHARSSWASAAGVAASSAERWVDRVESGRKGSKHKRNNGSRLECVIDGKNG